MGLEVFAEERHAATAIETMSAEFGVVRTNAVSDFKLFDIFPDSSNLSHSLMSRNQGELTQSVPPSLQSGGGFGVPWQ